MESIRWPEDYLPGLTDNFVSNEVIVQGLSVGTARQSASLARIL